MSLCLLFEVLVLLLIFFVVEEDKTLSIQKNKKTKLLFITNMNHVNCQGIDRNDKRHLFKS